MKKYGVTMARTEYLTQYIEIEADNEEAAIDKAWDQSGFWQRVEAEEFTNGVEELHPVDCPAVDGFGCRCGEAA